MVTFYEPQIEDLWFKETMLSDRETMSYNHAYGGTVPFPQDRWANWHDRWLVNHENKRFYRYVKAGDLFVGEAACHFDEERQIFLADVIIHALFRGKGYGRQALLLLCEHAKALGIPVLYDEIASDNPSLALFRKCGFTEVLRTTASVLVKKELSD